MSGRAAGAAGAAESHTRGEERGDADGVQYQMSVQYKEFGYPDAAPAHTAAYLLPAIYKLWPQSDRPQRILDVGCGNGYIAGQFLAKGHRVVGLDLSPEGIELARKTYPSGRFELMEADEKVLEKLGEE